MLLSVEEGEENFNYKGEEIHIFFFAAHSMAVAMTIRALMWCHVVLRLTEIGKIFLRDSLFFRQLIGGGNL